MSRSILKVFFLIICGISLCSYQKKNINDKPQENPRIVNIINFIRGVEPRIPAITDEVLYETVVQQIKCLRQNHLKATFLIQYDALVNPKYQKLLKEAQKYGFEIGGWWEITQPHVEAAGLKWRGKYSWDWHANVGFSTGYSTEERERLVDVYMKKFKEIFGKYPSSVGSWFIDAHTLSYMYDKYHVIASCNCKDQVGTDGYTLWGGYWGQGYYPSRKNAYMPAQTQKAQIPVPIFRMLGSDPIYQYDCGIGGEMQSVITLEPACSDGGGSPDWVRWFFKTMFSDPCINYTYTQAGQENSFTWDAMKNGYEMQMPMLAGLQNQKKISIQTLSETGTWYKSKFSVTPSTAVSALSDYKNRNRKTVWFDSRFYRTNLLWEGHSFLFRDIHLFNEDYASDYLSKAGTSTRCVYMTLPFVDGCLWSTKNQLAGLRIYCTGNDGKMAEMKCDSTIVSSKGNTFRVIMNLDGKGVAFIILLKEKEIEVMCDAKNKNFIWDIELNKYSKANMPFVRITDTFITAVQNNFVYHIRCKQGMFVDCRKESKECIFKIKPQNQKVILMF